MSYIYSFEKLEVWKDARKFVTQVYRLTEEFPTNEVYGLRSQMRRAAVSIVSNIAEGSSRTSEKDQAYFYQIAFSSTVELLNQFIIATDLDYLSDEELSETRKSIELITNKLNALRKSRVGR